MQRYFLYVIFTNLLISTSSLAQRGSFGDLTVTVQNEWLNTYTHLTNNANVGATSITVSSNAMSGAMFSGNLAAGDLILIIQMQGATVDINTYTTVGWGGDYTVQQSFFSNGNVIDETEFGQVTNYNNAGNYEYVEVRGISGGNTILLNCPLTKQYTAAGHVQVVRVPRISNLTVQNNASISCPLWNGQTGGVVALEVDGNLTLNGTGAIDANGRGFRGGLKTSSNNMASGTGGGGQLGSFNSQLGGEKGEGIAGHYAEYDALYSRYLRGAIANGGGGANFHNAGGGGGSNVGTGVYYAYGVPDPGATNQFLPAWNLENPNMVSQPSAGGGRGGYSHAISAQNPLTQAPNTSPWSGDYRRFAHGHGGHPLTYNINRVFMGGGGGGGHENDAQGGSGGRGGGIVMIDVYGTVSGTGTIRANGENGQNAQGTSNPSFGQKSGDDGAGGAGGGGSVIIRNINVIPASINLSARGGNGGNQILVRHFAATNQMDGPGGGGGGGLISFTSGSPNQDVSGGVGGTTNSTIGTNFPFNGATGGAPGMTNMPINSYDLDVEDVTICGGGNTTITVDVLGTLPIGSSIQWYTQPYGGSSFHTGASYTTPVLGANTTYYVGVCPGTYRKEVNVLVSPPITITGTEVISNETCNGNDGAITGLTASGGFGALTYDWNGVATPSEDLTSAVGGSYTLTVTDENGCEAIAGPFVVGASPGPSIDISAAVIQGETCNGDDGFITGITATGNNITWTWNGAPSASLDLIDIPAGSYTLIVTDEDGCTSQAGPFNVDAIAPPTVDLTNLVIADETCFGNDGSISGIVVSGISVTYEWNGTPAFSPDLNDLSADDYTLVVTDANGCEVTAGPFTVNLIPGPSIDESNIVISDENCNQLDGSITGLVATGNGLTYEWNGISNPSADITNIAAGSYTLVVTDNIGCTAESGPHLVAPVGGPEVDDSGIVIVGETCNGSDGSITGLVVTGSGLTYSWNGDPYPSADLTGVEAGSYVLVVVDNLGCNTVYGPVAIGSVPPPSIDDANLVVIPESCDGNDGVISGLDLIGDGISITWNGEASTTADLSGIQAGDYTIEITDENGCTASYGPINVVGLTPPLLTVTPITTLIEQGDDVQINAVINPELGTEIIVWTPSNDLSCDNCLNPIASPNTTTLYTITVTDENGCVSSEQVLIEVENPCGELFVPTIFSPNGDGLHDAVCVMGGCFNEFQFEIFNRWGEKVFESNNPDECWDGTFRGKPMNTGVFVYKAIGTREDGTSFKIGGNITLVR